MKTHLLASLLLSGARLLASDSTTLPCGMTCPAAAGTPVPRSAPVVSFATLATSPAHAAATAKPAPTTAQPTPPATVRPPVRFARPNYLFM